MTKTIEQIPQTPTIDPAIAQAVGRAGIDSLGIEHPSVARGDRQFANEPNRGFTIVRFEHEQPPALARDILPLSYSQDTEPVCERITANIANGTTLVDPIPYSNTNAKWTPKEPILTYPIDESTYARAVNTGQVAPDIFAKDDTINALQPGTEALDKFVPTEVKTPLIKAAVEKVLEDGNVFNYVVNDLAEISKDPKLQITEAYDFTDSSVTGRNNSIRLLNGSKTRISEEQLRQVSNVIRSYSDKSGGLVFDSLDTIFIVSDGSLDKKSNVGADIPYVGERRGGVLFVSERAIQTLEDRKPWSEDVKKDLQTRYDNERLPGEPKTGPSSPINNVSRDGLEPDFEKLLAHELGHDGLREYDNLEGAGPTLYSRQDNEELRAEIAALDYSGWDTVQESLDVPRAEREAKLAIWERQRQAIQTVQHDQRGSNDGGLTYQTPLGPRFITCRELDLTGPLPVRWNGLDKIPAVVKYHLVRDTPEIQEAVAA